MPISALAGARSRNDFQQTRCGGTKLLHEFTYEIALFCLHERRFFQFLPEIPRVWVHFALFKHKMSTNRAILISKRTRPTAVGNRRILRKMQSKKGDEGRKTDNHEKRPSGYNWNMHGLWDQDVQDRWRRWGRRRQGQGQKGYSKEERKEQEEKVSYAGPRLTPRHLFYVFNLAIPPPPSVHHSLYTRPKITGHND